MIQENKLVYSLTLSNVTLLKQNCPIVVEFEPSLPLLSGFSPLTHSEIKSMLSHGAVINSLASTTELERTTESALIICDVKVLFFFFDSWTS